MKKLLLGLAALLTAMAGWFGSDMLGAGRMNYFQRGVFDDLAATSTVANTSALNVADYQHVGFTVILDATTGTLKFACSMSDEAPNFFSAQGDSAPWDYVDVTDLQDNSSIDGDVGLVMVNSTTLRQFKLTNTNVFRYCTANLSPWTAGTTSVRMLGSNNN